MTADGKKEIIYIKVKNSSCRTAGSIVLLLCLLLIPTDLRPPIRPPFLNMIGPLPISRPPQNTSPFFSIPEALYPQTAFWKKIFTEYTLQQVLIHDEWYVNVIYEIVEPEEGKKTDRQAVRAAQEKYRELLKEMGEKWDEPETMRGEVRQLRLLFKDIPESPRFPKKDAWERVHVQRGQADSFRQGFIRAGRYREEMKEILEAYDLPEELVCLPLIESAYNPYAVSFVGAAGLWQLMDFTAKQYGLRMNHIADQRRDPQMATAAAALHLANNFRVLRSWPLAITAYNHGLQGMRNAVRAVNSDDISDIIEKYDGRSFGFASRNFYPEFLAAVEISAEPEKYYGELRPVPRMETETFELPHYVSVETLEKFCGLSAEDIRKQNPALLESAYDSRNFLPKGYPLRLSQECRIHMEEIYARIPHDLKYAKLPSPTWHRVKRGQTLSEIAQLSGIAARDLARFNNIRNPRHIRPGQRLKIPGKMQNADMLTAQAVQKEKLPEKKNIRTGKEKKQKSRHRVRKGQTLSEIAEIYGISEKAIARMNKLRNARHIRAGQVLQIPEG